MALGRQRANLKVERAKERGMKNMGTRAYFMINVGIDVSKNGYLGDPVKELEEMPEVRAVEPVFGLYDLMVEVDAPVRVIHVANKIMEKYWVKRLHILRTVATEPEEIAKGGLMLGEALRARAKKQY
jgi:hypothetical protein